MPTYEYACRSCGERLEAVQAFTDEALTTCPRCGGELRKVFGSVGIVFKGGGFYKTDSRQTSSSVTPAASEPAHSHDHGPGDTHGGSGDDHGAHSPEPAVSTPSEPSTSSPSPAPTPAPAPAGAPTGASS